MRLARALFIVAFVGLACSSAPAAGLDCETLPLVLRAFQSHHYSMRTLDQTLEERTTSRLIDILDGSKTLLLQSDVDKLRSELPRMFESMREGNCARLDAAWSLIVTRAAEDERLAQGMLGKGYKLDESVELMLDPDKRTYAKTPEERAARVRKMIHFQISNYLVSGLELDKAKKQLAHRYELITKRLSERQAKGELPELFAQAFAEALDPHSAFMSADDLADFQIQMRLSLEGIGAVLSSQDGFTTIESLVPGGQAEKTGRLQPKDKIIAVKQEGDEPVSTIDMDLSDVVKMIRGKKGTTVTLTVLRDGQKRAFQVAIVRDKIDVSSSAAKITYETRKLGPRSFKIGVIDLPSFYGGDDNGRSSYADMKRLLAEANAERVDGLVLDLTRNGGGLLEDAVRISGLFIKRGSVVGTKDGQGRFEPLEDKDADVNYKGPLVVLVSRASASASEILAGALKDYRRAVVVGSDHTFGKGSVQVVVPLAPELGAIRVTTGMFFLPGGASTQARGVATDFRVPTLFDAADIGEVELDYALPAQQIPSFLSSSANGSDAHSRWLPVDAALVARLAQRSAERVAKDPEFKKLKDRVAEREDQRGMVKLSDLRSRNKDNGDKSEDRDELKAFGAVSAKEGVNIMADWLGNTLVAGAAAP